MRMLVFGSVNIDEVYRLNHMLRVGETLRSNAYRVNEGGKGLNQAIALSKAGQDVWFAGAIGRDGLFLKTYLESFGVHTDYLKVLDTPTGRAVIQVDDAGNNAILLFSGANACITADMIDETLAHFGAGDWVLLQNEISGGGELIRRAANRGMRIALNPSPVTPDLPGWPLRYVDLFLLNEIEGADLTGAREPDAIVNGMLEKFPESRVVLTLGGMGSMYAHRQTRLSQGIYPVEAVDTTAAGDTFTGYFLSGLLNGDSPERALKTSSLAASIAVSRPGAGKSIPSMAEVADRLREAE